MVFIETIIFPCLAQKVKRQLKIVRLDCDSLEKLKPLVRECEYLRFKELGADRDLAVKYTIQELSDIVSKGNLVLAAEEQDELVGAVSLERLTWDSRHFGTECSRISQLIARGDYLEALNIKQQLLSKLLANCNKKRSLHISARVSKEDLSSIHALENESFKLMDVLVTYSFNLQKQIISDKETQVQVRDVRREDIPQLADLARECFANNPVSTDRFHADPNLPKDKSGELYVKWVLASCRDKSNKVLVALLNGTPVGFTIGNLNEPLAERLGIRLGTVVLTGVKTSERGKRISESLWNALLKWFIDKVDVVETGVEVSNYAVQRALAKTGFGMVKSQCTFHWSKLASGCEF